MRLPKVAFAALLLLALDVTTFCAFAAEDGLSQDALTANAALQTKVSFEVKAQPFANFLRDLSKQSKVSFSVAPELEISKRLLTARVHELLLSEVMTSLSKLYNLSWVKDGEGFRAIGGSRNRVEQRIEQLGVWYRYWLAHPKSFPAYLTRRGLADRYETRDHQKPIMDQIWPFIRNYDPQKGVALTALPGDVQEQLRSYLEEYAGGSLLLTSRSAHMEQLSEGTLKVSPPPLFNRNAEGKLVLIRNGVLVARIESYGQYHLEWRLLEPREANEPALKPIKPPGAP